MTETYYIVDIVILLAAAVIAVPLFQRLGLGAVLGFLVAGAVVGPWGLGFISAVEEIRHLAEFGVIFLLFIIGIELKPSRLWVMRRSVFGLGTAQVLTTGTVVTLIALALGIPMRSALIVGFGLALSSTAFGLQILSDKGELGTGYGRSAFAILLLQDLAIVPLMALLPLLAQQELTITQYVELTALKSVVIVVGVFILGRILLRPVLQLVAKSRRNPEIFLPPPAYCWCSVPHGSQIGPACLWPSVLFLAACSWRIPAIAIRSWPTSNPSVVCCSGCFS